MKTPQPVPARILPRLRPLALVAAVLLAGCQGKGADGGADSLNVSLTTPPPAPAASATRFTEAHQGQEVVVAPGAEFEVVLAAAPAGDLAWTWADSANSSIVLVERTRGAVGVTSADTSATGATGTNTVWRFRAPTTGSAPIRLELRRPGEATAAQTYTLTVRPE